MIFQIHNPQDLPKTIAVRGISRQVGTTSIAANLALMLSQRGESALLLDLCLWNCDLTRLFGHAPARALVDLAQELDLDEALSMDLIDGYIKSCRSNLDLLPGTEHWLESSLLQAENGWNFIHSFLIRAVERWSIVIADLGSHVPSTEPRDNTFLPSCAVHASILQAVTSIVGVCDSIEYLKLWQEHANQDLDFYGKTIYVINQHRSDLPFGLDRYKVNPRMRSQSHFIPALKGGLVADDDGLFFVERIPHAGDVSGEEKKALREFQDLAAQVNRQILHKGESDRSAESFSST